MQLSGFMPLALMFLQLVFIAHGTELAARARPRPGQKNNVSSQRLQRNDN
jgi:hypothetical protein